MLHHSPDRGPVLSLSPSPRPRRSSRLPGPLIAALLLGTVAAAEDFTFAWALNGHSSARSVQATDLDGDGDVDFLVGSDGGLGISWFENLDGQGTPGRKQIISSDLDLVSHARAGDLDGDGDEDVVGFEGDSPSILWFENLDGEGAFGPSQVAVDFGGPAHLTSRVDVGLADLDADGDLDLLFSRYHFDTIQWCENLSGAGAFGPPQTITTQIVHPYCASTADVDGDGDLDVLAISPKPSNAEVAWIENTNGSATAWTKHLIDGPLTWASWASFADPDGDGDRDVLFASNDNVAWYENTNGLGAFGPQIVVEPRPSSKVIESIDIDADGDEDLVVSGNGAHVWYENLGGGGIFGSPNQIDYGGTSYTRFDFADIDGDTDLDVVAEFLSGSGPAWYENADGAGGFGPGHGLTFTTTDTRCLVASDLDGDGDDDVLAASFGENKLVWFENLDGTGEFEREWLISDQVPGASCIETGDIDGDGDEDVVAGTFPGNTIGWFENETGEGDFGPVQTISTGVGGVTAVRARDLDGDGDLDILSAAFLAHEVAWYENLDGAGSFGAMQIISNLADYVRDTDAADLDGDGDLDVVISQFTTGVTWHRNVDGAGTFGPSLRISSLSATHADGIDICDVDGDGDLDLFGSVSDAGRFLRWWENVDGLGTFQAHDVAMEPNYIAPFPDVDAADLDGDGDRDLVAAHPTEDCRWYENLDGIGTSWSERPIQTRFDVESLLVTDSNHDGRPDLIVAQNQIDWLRNNVHDAEARFRNAGANPASYSTSWPVLGTNLIGRVDVGGTTGHSHALLAAYSGAMTFALGGGQMALVDPTGPELLGLPVAAGPMATFTVPIPSDVAYVGCEVFSQAAHFGIVQPFALTNAVDWTIDY